MTEDVLEEAELVRFVTVPESGGVVCFSGVVRNHHEGQGVLRIEYSAARALAERKLRQVAEEVLEVTSAYRAAALHRLGTLEVGEASVLVAASAAHRDEAFRAARLLIDRLKETLPVWKREHFEDGTTGWVPGFTVADGDRAGGPPVVGPSAEVPPC
ncbi:MAG: molybdenum cofactor biosynthesis protein MoaE [Gemmatimonadetes bacterium]|nr:molybdenum cofactor biosynthesis protein MoaE [Gemmatimonadota bacterium]